MKKIFVVLFVVALFFACPAFAFEEFDLNAIPVSGLHETSVYRDFAEGQTPWIYVNLSDFRPQLIFWHSNVYTEWRFDSVKMDDENRTYQLNGLEFWINSDKWAKISNVGRWDINGSFTIKDLSGVLLNSGNITTHFNVTAVPEPISTILFLTGGTILAVRRLRRKR